MTRPARPPTGSRVASAVHDRHAAVPAQADGAGPDTDEHDHDEEAPRFDLSRKKVVFFVLFVVLAVGGLYFLAPQLSGIDDTYRRIEQGNPWWLALCLLLTVVSFGGYVMLFQAVYVRGGSRIDWRASYQITMAGLAASRVFSAGGAGGILLTAWALRRSGMKRQTVADKSVSFIVVTYLIYMAAVIVGGFGLWVGLFPGPAPFGVTVVPAIAATVVTALGLSMALVPTDFERRLEGWARRHGRLGRLAQRLATVPSTVSAGMRDALAHVRDRDPALIGAIVYWAAQIGVLWAAFHAFGGPPPLAVIVVGFFVGMLGNLLPLPGGVGGVDGGMIGAFLAFGVNGGLALVAVLVFRAFVFWLPTIPGVIAYFQLRRTVDRWRYTS